MTRPGILKGQSLFDL